MALEQAGPDLGHPGVGHDVNRIVPLAQDSFALDAGPFDVSRFGNHVWFSHQELASL